MIPLDLNTLQNNNIADNFDDFSDDYIYSAFNDDDWDIFLAKDFDTNIIDRHNNQQTQMCCYTSDVTGISDPVRAILRTVMANETVSHTDDQTFAFMPERPSFGTDNYATHHACNDISLFIGEIKKITNIGIRGVGGIATAAGIGTVEFILTSEDGIREKIQLENVIYLPDCPKKLLSITRWSKDRGDNAGIFSRGEYSIFLWDNDKSRKIIHHPSECPIPLMMVNEGEDDVVSAYISARNEIPASEKMNLKVAQQPTGQGLILPVGTTVRYHDNNTMRICSVIGIDQEMENNQKGTKIRVLNSEKEFTVPNHLIAPINDPEPSDILQHPEATNKEGMTDVLSQAQLNKLWKTPDSDFSNDERLFYYWHKRLRHAPKKHIRRLAKRGCLPKQLQFVTRMPICAACAFADASKRNWRGKSEPGKIRKDTDKRGSNTPCDHLISHEPGLIPQVTGRLTYQKYAGAIVFTDHFSDFTYTHLIRGTTTEEKLLAKRAYERVAKAHGVQVMHYHADNLRFNDKEFQDDCDNVNQTYSYCGVGAHHMNGIAEAKNKTLSYGARKSLLHARRHWPKVIKASLWPFPLLAHTKSHNELPLDEDGKSPLEKYSDTEAEIYCKDFHTWGCPVFVLDEANQSGMTGTPKWEARSRAGVYLGHSNSHAGSVALVLNLQTGHVSPQYHVVFYDDFTTVDYIQSGEEPPNWCRLVADSSEKVTDERYDLARTWYEGQSKHEKLEVHENSSDGSTKISENLREPVGINDSDASKPGDPLEFVDLANVGLRRGKRKKKPSVRLKESNEPGNSNETATMKKLYGLMVMVNDMKSSMKNIEAEMYTSFLEGYDDYLDLNFDGTQNSMSILGNIYLSGKINNEIYTLKEMMEQPDRKQFEMAMYEEVKAMFDNQIWEKVPKTSMHNYYNDLRRKGCDIKRQQIMMIWSFKRKIHQDGRLSKYKARLCCHGGQQQWGVQYWETYSPVVSWMAVRTLLVLSKIHNLHTKCIDFTLAFPQADVKVPIYLMTPTGISLDNNDGDTVLKLRKNLYGLKDAGRTWWEFLSDGLHEMGFHQTETDQCVFIKDDVIILIYVDDCVIISKDEKKIEDTITCLRKRYAITDEENMEEYLGIKLEHTGDSIRMSQPLLIERIIDAVPGMRKANPVKYPALPSVILTKDENGNIRREHWNYRSLIGMLNFLTNSSHPELAFAVHQCARFCNDPKRIHEQAVRRIIQYLLSTKRGTDSYQGLLFKVDITKSIDVYVDASFAGDWNISWSENPSSVFSRT